MKYSIDWSKFSWQHTILVVAGAVSVAAEALPPKATTICAAAANMATCSNTLASWCATVGSVAVVVTMIFGGSSHSLLKKKEPATQPASP